MENTTDKDIEQVTEPSNSMLPKSSTETKTARHKKCFGLCGNILVIMVIISIFFLVSAKTEFNKVRKYKEARCTLKSARVYRYRSGKSSYWKAAWTVLFKVSNSPAKEITFAEEVPGSYFILRESTAAKHLNQRQVNNTYPCFYGVKSSVVALENATIEAQWEQPTKKKMQRSLYLGIAIMVLCIVPLFLMLRIVVRYFCSCMNSKV